MLYKHLKWFSPSPEEESKCLEILNKTGGIVARHFNKRISLPISLVLSRMGIRPNSVTWFNMVVGVLAGLLAARGTYSTILWGTIVLQIASILDGVDGEIAKLTDTSSQFGQWLDTISDNMTFFLFIAGLTVGLYRSTGDPAILVAGEISFVSSLLFLILMLVYLRRNSDSGSLVTFEKEMVNKVVRDNSGFLSSLMHYGRYLIKKDSFTAVFLLLAALRFPQGILYATALGTSVAFVLTLYFGLRKKSSLALAP